MAGRFFSDPRGFTLVELAVVLLVTSIMIALTAPAILRNFGSLSLKTAAKRTGGALRYSRSRAVCTGTAYNTVFDTGKNRVMIIQVLPPRLMNTESDEETETGDDFQEVNSEATRPNRKQEVKTYDLPQGIRFAQIVIGDIDSTEQDDGGIYQTVFFPGGSSRGGEIVLADEKDRMYRVAVNRITGVVTIAEKEED